MSSMWKKITCHQLGYFQVRHPTWRAASLPIPWALQLGVAWVSSWFLQIGLVDFFTASPMCTPSWWFVWTSLKCFQNHLCYFWMDFGNSLFPCFLVCSPYRMVKDPSKMSNRQAGIDFWGSGPNERKCATQANSHLRKLESKDSTYLKAKNLLLDSTCWNPPPSQLQVCTSRILFLKHAPSYCPSWF